MRPGMGVWQAGIDGLQVGHARILRTRGRRRYDDSSSPGFAVKQRI